MKKITAILLLVICVAVMFIGCTQDTDILPQDGKVLMEESGDIRDVSLYSIATETDEKKFLNAVQTFSANLCKKIYDSDASLYDKNTALSPLSVYMALAMAVECSGGNTRSEILQMLGLTYEQVLAYTGDLYSASTRQYGCDDEISLIENLSNSVWLQSGLQYGEDCLKALSEDYYCSSYITDFYGDTKGSNQKIREYVKEKTKGLIDSDFDLDKYTVVALINTLYLKSVWNDMGFDLNKTEENYDFHCQNGTVESTKLLQGKYVLGKTIHEQDYSAMYASSTGCQVYFILPNDGKTLQDVFTAENIQKTIAANYNQDDKTNRIHYYTRCLFPEFHADYSGELKDIIANWGVQDLFDPNNCDFSPILPSTQSYCGTIIHKTELNVDKEGIEGAAVTIIANKATSCGPDGWETRYEDFVVDKAFGYVITDTCGNILFAGTVANTK